MERSEGKIHATKHSEEIAKSCQVVFESIFIRPNSQANNLIYQIYITDKVIENSSKAGFSFLEPF